MNQDCPRCHERARCYWRQKRDGKGRYDEYTLHCPSCMYLEIWTTRAGFKPKTRNRRFLTVCPYCKRVCRRHNSETLMITALKERHGGGENMAYIFEIEIDFIATVDGFVKFPEDNSKLETFKKDIEVSSVHTAKTTALDELDKHVQSKYGLNSEVLVRVIKKNQIKETKKIEATVS